KSIEVVVGEGLAYSARLLMGDEVSVAIKGVRHRPPEAIHHRGKVALGVIRAGLHPTEGVGDGYESPASVMRVLGCRPVPAVGNGGRSRPVVVAEAARLAA